jgi:uncharacterized protein (DUF1778 family)
MQKHQNKKLTFEFPAEEYIFLKMACAKQGVSMKDFVTKAIIKSIDEYEAHLDSTSYQALTQEERDHAIPLEQLEKELGWDKL